MNPFLIFGLASLLTACVSPQSSTTSVSTTSNYPLNQTSITTLYDYTITDPQGLPLSLSQLVDHLKEADIILVGEWHTHPAAHLLQTQLFAALYQQNPNITLSMEQFTRDKQAIINDYLSGKIGENTLKTQANAWQNYDSDYRPLIEFAKQHQLNVIAANAPRKIVKCVGRQGENYLNKLPKHERQWVARKLTLNNDTYQQKFMASMHHGNETQTSRLFAAQTTWDDTMAESIVDYLQQNPHQQIIHTAGRFHTAEGLGIGSRIKLRDPHLKIMMVTPISAQHKLNINAPDFRVMMAELPPRYVQQKNMMAAMKHIGKRHTDLKCD